MAKARAAHDDHLLNGFLALTHVHPMIEKYPIDRVAEAFEQMHSGKVRFHAVLTFP